VVAVVEDGKQPDQRVQVEPVVVALEQIAVLELRELPIQVAAVVVGKEITHQQLKALDQTAVQELLLLDI
jgi:hypothetical protein